MGKFIRFFDKPLGQLPGGAIIQMLMNKEVTFTVPLTPPNPSGLCMCGCGGKAPIAKMTNRRQGCIAGHAQKYIMGHQGKLAHPYIVNAATGCWEWQGHIDANGYGRASVGPSRSKQAHIVYYERYVGSIPKGLEVDHICRCRRCVNPAHLEAVTRTENIRRQPQTKLSPEEVEKIKAAFVGSPFGGRRGGNIREVVTRFNISRSQIYRVVKGESWKNKA